MKSPLCRYNRNLCEKRAKSQLFEDYFCNQEPVRCSEYQRIETKLKKDSRKKLVKGLESIPK